MEAEKLIQSILLAKDPATALDSAVRQVLLSTCQNLRAMATMALEALRDTQAMLEEMRLRCAGLEVENEYLRLRGKLRCPTCGGEKDSICFKCGK